MLWTCSKCGTRYAHSLGFCPHCGSRERELEEDMPKISRKGGASNNPNVPEPATDAVVVDAEPASADAAATTPKPEPEIVEFGGEVETDRVLVSEQGLVGEQGSELVDVPGPVMPTVYASKQMWVDYAVSQGKPEEEASAATKAQLIDHYFGTVI